MKTLFFVFLTAILSLPALAQTPTDSIRTVPVPAVRPDTLPVLRPDTLPVIRRDTLPAVKPDTVRAAKADALPSIRKDTTYWKRNGQMGINLNQGSFSDNWTGGGVNSIALGLVLNARADYIKDRINWTSEVQLQYGVVKNEGQQTRKNIDRLFADSKFGYRITRVWQLYGSGNLLSQFAPGYRYENLTGGGERRVLISGFFAPAYVTESIGFEYKPTTYFNLQLGVATLRQTIVSDDAIAVGEPKRYGVPAGRRVRSEAAFQVVTNFDRDIAKNLNFKARYLIFAGYDRMTALDHRLDASLTAKVNNLFNVNLTTIVLYDKDQSRTVQYSQALAIGLLYKF